MAAQKKSNLWNLVVRFSGPIFAVLVILAGIGSYLGSTLPLRLSLTDLLPADHPSVKKLNQLTQRIGGIGYLTVVLTADDRKSHLAIAPILEAELEKSPLVRSAFFHRDQRFFADRMLYYFDIEKLQKLEREVDQRIRRAGRQLVDLGLFDDEASKAEDLDPEFKKLAQRASKMSPFLTSEDQRYLLLMIKPTFDSTDIEKSEELLAFAGGVLKQHLPSTVSYEFAERYYIKMVEIESVRKDIFLLGAISIFGIMLILLVYLKSFRGVCLIFIPVFLGMGITLGLTRLVIGQINIVTGFLMGIISGLGVDYGIHLFLRLRLERQEGRKGSTAILETLTSSGHSVFVGAVSAAFAFLLLCVSSFKAFSEFGFICGVGMLAVLFSLLGSFAFLVKILKVDQEKLANVVSEKPMRFPVLSVRSGLLVGGLCTLAFVFLGSRVGFEYDFNKMMQYSKKAIELTELVDQIYQRSSEPSAFAVPDREEAIRVENRIKEKFVPKLVTEVVSGATIIPEAQNEKREILQRIQKRVKSLNDRWMEKALDIPGSTVRRWLAAQPFVFEDLPKHLKDALRGRQQDGYLIYFYPSIKFNTAMNVRTFAQLARDIESVSKDALIGSDAVVFSDILDLIEKDGKWLLLAIFTSVGFFIWMNIRNFGDSLLSYLPLLIALPVSMGLMVLFDIKFNIFNIAFIPTFVAVGIDVPIHLVHRTRETGSGYQAVRDLAASIHLSLLTAALGFGVLVFARAGVLKSLGWIALLSTLAIWWVGMFLLPAYLERSASLKTAVRALRRKVSRRSAS